MSDTKSIDIVLAISGTEYVAPDYGYFAISIDADNVRLNGEYSNIYKAEKGKTVTLEYDNLRNIEYFKFIVVDEPIFMAQATPHQLANTTIPFDKPEKPDSFLPKKFGGVKNNFSEELIENGYQNGVPAVLGGDNLNWLIDNMGKTMTYYTLIADYFCSLTIGKTPWISKDNKFSQTSFGFRVYNFVEEYQKHETVLEVYDDDTFATYVSLRDDNTGHPLTDTDWWFKTGFNMRPANTKILGGVIPDGKSILVNDEGRISANIVPDGDTIIVDEGGHFSSVYPAIGDPIPTFNKKLASNEVWLEGDEVLESDYPNLYEIYGDDYLPPNTQKREGYFYLPNCIDRVWWGATDFGYIEAGLPNITGSFVGGNQHISPTGSFSFEGNSGSTQGGGGFSEAIINFNASRSSSLFGKSQTVQPPGIKIRVKTRFK